MTEEQSVLGNLKLEGGPIEVDRELFDQIMEMRDSGAVSMVARDDVQEIAKRTGKWALYLFIRDEPDRYSAGIFTGFAVSES